LSTIYKWTKKLGFNYEPRRNSYDVDEHEKESTINYYRKVQAIGTGKVTQMCQW